MDRSEDRGPRSARPARDQGHGPRSGQEDLARRARIDPGLPHRRVQLRASGSCSRSSTWRCCPIFTFFC
jgi:hypothetical protein